MLNRESTSLADAVLAYVTYLADDDDEDRVDIDVFPYQNGREHGYALSWLGIGDPATGRYVTRQAVFSVARSSDNIVLYTGNSGDFDINSIPREEAYARKRFFGWDAAAVVARAALAYLRRGEE